MIVLFRFDDATHERASLEVFPRTDTHCQKVHRATNSVARRQWNCRLQSGPRLPNERCRINDLPEFVNKLLRDPFPILLTPNGFGIDLLHEERPDGLVEPPVPVIVVWAVEPGTKPRRLCIRDEGKCAGSRGFDTFRLTAYGADLETRVLRAQEDFMAVETKEDVCRILTGWCGGCGVTVNRFRYVVTYRRRTRRERWLLRDGGLRTG